MPVRVLMQNSRMRMKFKDKFQWQHLGNRKVHLVSSCRPIQGVCQKESARCPSSPDHSGQLASDHANMEIKSDQLKYSTPRGKKLWRHQKLNLLFHTSKKRAHLVQVWQMLICSSWVQCPLICLSCLNHCGEQYMRWAHLLKMVLTHVNNAPGSSNSTYKLWIPIGNNSLILPYANAQCKRAFRIVLRESKNSAVMLSHRHVLLCTFIINHSLLTLF